MRGLLFNFSLRFAAAWVVFAMTTSAFAQETAAVTESESEAVKVTLTFSMHYNGLLIAESTDIVTREKDGGYAIHSRARAQGLGLLYGDVLRESKGVMATINGEAMPQTARYFEKRGRRREQEAVFDYEAGQVALRRGDKKTAESLPKDGPVFDHLTALYRAHFSGAPASGHFYSTDGRRLKKYLYTLGEEAVLQTALGEVRALPLTRNDTKRITYWLAAQMDFLPVKIVMEDNGDKFLFEILSIGRAQPAH